MSEELKGGIYKKMMTIFENVDYIVKDMSVEYGANKYKAVSEEAILTEVRKHLISHDVYVHCISQVRKREGNITSVEEVFRFVDLDDMSYIDIPTSGEGADTQDKGVGKAQTYSFKYLFRRAFGIPTGEDTDRVHSAKLDDIEKQNAVDQGKRRIMQMLEDNLLDDSFKSATIADVDEAYEKKDVDTLRIIYREVQTEVNKLARQIQKAKEYGEEPPLPDSTSDDGGLF